jgi:2,3-bisphosphoglycerate-dependent phosphoglycerate mutase
MATLVLLRHGESEWNKLNRFTGWTDVDLSEKGQDEALQAGRLLRESGIDFDVAYTSVLKRAIHTMWIVLDQMDFAWLPAHTCWRLNERHYGALQGLDKAQSTIEFGEEKLKLWRRSYLTRPPQLDPCDARYPGHDRRYAHLRPDQLPLGESLKDTAERLWPYWQHSISVALRQRQRVLIVAHGNSLRALVKYLDGISDADIADVEIPTGVPLVYQLDADLNRMGEKYILTGGKDKRPTKAVAARAGSNG